MNLQSLPQTIGLEYQDRINRFNRLAALYGIKPPKIDQLQLSAGTIPGVSYPIPVVRIIFDGGVFFDFNKDTVRPEAARILDVIADNMRRDVPDARVLILGHTDAIGTDAYNIDLSRRRATFVMRELVRRGVNPAQLATVAIGKSQPRAPNDTEEGRAINRRVEFMISARQEANTTLVERRRINEDYLRVTANEVLGPVPVAHVEVYGLAPLPVATKTPNEVLNQPQIATNPTVKSPDSANEVTLQPVGEIVLQKPVSVVYELNRPAEYQPNKLNDEFKL